VILFDRVLKTLSLLTMILAVGRFLGPSDLAVYSLFMSLFGFFSMIVYFNTDSVLLRTFKLSTDVESASLLKDIFSFKLIVGIFSMLLFSISAFVLLKGYIFINVILSITILLNTVDVVETYFQSAHRFEELFWVRFAVFIVGMVMKIVFIVKVPALEVLLIIYLIEHLTIFLFYYYKAALKLTLSMQNIPLIMKVYRNSFYIFLSGVLLLIASKLDLYVFTFSGLDMIEIGFYAAAMTVISGFNFLASVLSGIEIVRLSGQNENDLHEGLCKFYRKIHLISLSLALVFYFFGGWLLLLLFGPDFQPTVKFVKNLSFLIPFFWLQFSQIVWISLKNLSHYAFYQTLMFVVLLLISEIVLSKSLGMNGVVLALYVSYAITFILTPFIYKKRIGLMQLGVNMK
jgi:O-antigen/teichoic acid export membrane protein